jgi:hypothetical protein
VVKSHVLQLFVWSHTWSCFEPTHLFHQPGR